MTYSEWFWQNMFWNMVMGGAAILVGGLGYVVWVKLQEWYEGE